MVLVLILDLFLHPHMEIEYLLRQAVIRRKGGKAPEPLKPVGSDENER